VTLTVDGSAVYGTSASQGVLVSGGGTNRVLVEFVQGLVTLGVIDAVEERAPDGFENIDDVLSYEERKAIVRGYASTAGFAREQVNRSVEKAA